MLLTILVRLVDLYSTLIVVYVLFSWIPQKSGILYDIDSVLRRICEPYLGFFRRIIPPIGIMDISPIVAILALEAIVRLIVAII